MKNCFAVSVKAEKELLWKILHVGTNLTKKLCTYKITANYSMFTCYVVMYVAPFLLLQ